jgi:hypothetical protein
MEVISCVYRIYRMTVGVVVCVLEYACPSDKLVFRFVLVCQLQRCVYTFPDPVFTIHPGKLHRVETFNEVLTHARTHAHTHTHTHTSIQKTLCRMQSGTICLARLCFTVGLGTLLSWDCRPDSWHISIQLLPTGSERQKCGLINKTISQTSFLSSNNNSTSHKPFLRGIFIHTPTYPPISELSPHLTETSQHVKRFQTPWGHWKELKIFRVLLLYNKSLASTLGGFFNFVHCPTHQINSTSEVSTGNV